MVALRIPLAALWRLESRRILPLPPPESYVDFCGSVILPDGKAKNRAYNPATHGPQLTVLQALDGGVYFAPRPFREAAVAKPVQDGGSLCTVIPLLRRVIRQRQAALIAFPSLDSAKDVWTTKVSPILAAYGGQEPESGGGSKGGAARVITLPGGGRFFLRAAGGRGESQQASVTGDALCIDEVDDWPDLHRIKLITKRLEEAADPLLLLVSTVKLPTGSLILSAVEEGTNSRLHYRCPDCRKYTTLEWSNVKYQREGQACVGGTAVIVCPHCACMWDEGKRKLALFDYLVVHRGQTINDKGEIEGPIPDTPRFSLRWNRIESPRKTLHSLCAEHAIAQWYLEAKNESGYMRSFYQDYLTSSFVDESAKDDGIPAHITLDYLAERSNRSDYKMVREERKKDGDSWHTAEKHDGVQWFTLSVDVQRGGVKAPPRLYWLLMGWDPDWRSWDTAWGHVIVCPAGRQATEGELHAALDRLDGMTRSLEGEYGKPIARRGIDVADQQDALRDWLIKKPEWWAVRGAATKMTAHMEQSRGFDLAGWIYRREQQERSKRWWLYLMDTHACRQEAQNGFLAEGGKPGAAHIPYGLDRSSTLLRHYCASILIPDGRGGLRWSAGERDRQAHPEWQTRHDYLDNRTMGTALARSYAHKPRSAPPQEDPNQPRQPGWIDSYVGPSGGSWLAN